MKKNIFTGILRFSAILVLIAAMALSLFSCGSNTALETPMSGSDSTSGEFTDTEQTDVWAGLETTEGKYCITVTVTDDKGVSKAFSIKTDADNLGAALTASGLVEGEAGPYGLYIKKVTGILADYDANGAYWALTKDGEYLMSGADTTPIADGDRFELTYTKG